MGEEEKDEEEGKTQEEYDADDELKYPIWLKPINGHSVFLIKNHI